MSMNIDQVFIANPITSNASTDLMYFGQSPYAPIDDAAMTYANFSAQFGAPYTASALTEVNDTNVTLTLGGTPATSLLHAVSITAGWSGTLSGTRGGTGVNNGANTITLGGNISTANSFTTSGNFTVIQTYTGITNVTFPQSGTLATTSQLPTPAALTESNDTNVTLTLGGTPSTALLQATSITAGWSGTLSLARGGLAANNTASNGGIFYSTATAGAILSGTATAGQLLTSGASTTPAWTTTTYPLTNAINTIMYASSANVLGVITPVNSAVMISSAGGIPSFSTTLPAGLIIPGYGVSAWVDETSSSFTMATNTGYTSDDGASLVTFTLPTTSAIGDFVEINGKGSGGWTIAQGAGQLIHFGSSPTTSGASGSLSSSNQYDCVRLRCLTANTIWTVASAQGNPTVV